MKIRTLALIVIFISTLYAQEGQLNRNIKPDERYKADVLLVVAHPDDETAVGSYLAKLIFDEHRKVAVIYTNRGQGGGNSIGIEQSQAMGEIREIEARKALAKFGIENVWFLNGYDTPGQDVLHALKNLKHGAALESMVRFIRLTRPEVIFTWLPHFVAGENHGDHQASGVVATEAFDMAGDPTAFPDQVATPRERMDIGNFNEGLNPWQANKIYYFSDADEEVIAPGPKFDASEISPSRKLPYYEIASELNTPHLTQGDVSESGLKAQKTGDFTEFKNYHNRFHLIFGKSVVRCSPEGDVFEGVTSGAHPYVAPRGYEPRKPEGLGIQLGGPFSFYEDFWRAHNIENVGPLIKPEINVAYGSYLNIPVIIRNNTKDSVTVTLQAKLPEGFRLSSGEGRYFLAPGETYPIETFVFAPAEASRGPYEVIWNALSDGKQIGSLSIKTFLSEWTLPQ
ncbi:MAG: PIG-L family deacetylase [Ignavibacteria bacterium]|nr:PIG-L family deacetylase [Ignavibacteria bacterium]MCU7505002.1 PIG-L family deacetylase [Ignavibacteria bacterium]MCU7514864.1 PIG-L family deacetylase [Ignavibacteria bacterium]